MVPALTAVEPKAVNANPIQVETASCVVCGSSNSHVIATGKDYLHRTTEQEYHYAECDDCRHLYLNPRPKLNELARIYPPEYATYTNAFRGDTNLIARVKDAVLMSRFKPLARHLPRDFVLLDVGCGDAQFLRAIRKSHPAAELHGVDWTFAEAVQREMKHFNIRPITGPIETADIGSAIYDVITMNQLIEHVWDVRRVLTACYNALKPGGLLAIETPCREGWDRRFFKSGAWGGYYWPRHLNLFSRTHLIQLIQGAGMEPLHSVPLLAPPCWISSFRYFLQRAGFGRTAGYVRDNSFFLLAGFAMVDKMAILLGAETSNQKLVARRPLNHA